MEGVLAQVNISSGGVPKRPVREARVSPVGLAGDGHADKRNHGGPMQAVCLFDIECLETMATEGFPVYPGALGENFTTRGIEYHAIRIGDVFRVGNDVLVQITKARAPCTTIQCYGKGIIKRLWGPTVPWGESGFYARVLTAGTVRPGDVVSLERAGAEAPPPFTRKTEAFPE